MPDKYPEHEKINRNSIEVVFTLHEFLEHMESKGYEVYQLNPDEKDPFMRGYKPVKLDRIVNEFWGIDENKLEEERKQMKRESVNVNKFLEDK